MSDKGSSQSIPVNHSRKTAFVSTGPKHSRVHTTPKTSLGERSPPDLDQKISTKDLNSLDNNSDTPIQKPNAASFNRRMTVAAGQLSGQEKKLVQARWNKVFQGVTAMVRLKSGNRSKQSLEPTYKLSPDPEKKFNPEAAEKRMQAVMNRYLETYEYSHVTAPTLAKRLSSLLNDNMKLMDCPRYKFVTNVLIMQNKKLTINFASRCVWDTQTDSFASCEIKGRTFVAVATVHGIYLD